MKTRLGVAAGALGLGLVPFALSSYQLGLLTKMLIFALFAMSLDVILGYGGLPSLGHAAYFGVGAYTVGLLAVRVIDNFWIDFGAGQWVWEGPYNVDPTNNVYFANSTGTSRTFAFSPAPRVLQSLRVYATSPGTLTLSDDAGQTWTQEVATGSMQLVTTGWTRPATTPW